MLCAKPYKVWNCDRSNKNSVIASTLRELIDKGCDKLGIPHAQLSKVVLEEDGTQVDDDDYFQCVEKNTVFLLLKENEIWKKIVEVSIDETDAAYESQIDYELACMIQSLRQDLSRIIVFTDIQLQRVVDTDRQVLARHLRESETFAKAVQDACQEHLDHRDQTYETAGLLKLFQEAQQAYAEAKESNKIEKPKDAPSSDTDVRQKRQLESDKVPDQCATNSGEIAKRVKKKE